MYTGATAKRWNMMPMQNQGTAKTAATVLRCKGQSYDECPLIDQHDGRAQAQTQSLSLLLVVQPPLSRPPIALPIATPCCKPGYPTEHSPLTALAWPAAHPESQHPPAPCPTARAP